MSVHASRAILAGVLTCVYTPQLFAQEKPERAGQAEIALQGYYIGGSQQPILDTSGVAIKLQSFFPKLGLLQVNLEGYSGQNRFRPGDNYVDLSNLIWKSTRWNLSGGDFRIPTTLTTFHFNNIIYPEISVRGGRVTARRGRQKYTVFYGLETLQAGPRIPFRVSPGQNVLGASFQYAASEKLEFGVQFLNLTNGQSTNQYAATLKLPGREFRAANIASAQISYKPLKKVTFFAEVNTSSVQRPAATEPDASFEVPVSRKQDWTREAAAVAGVQWDTERVTVRANYVRQGAFYMPIAGFFLGDRQGPYAELRYRLFSRLELYASTSRYENNLARRADLPTYHSRSETAGANLRLPARFSASGSLTLLKFRSQGQEVFQNSNTKNQLWTATLSKSIYKHNLRLTYREIKLSLISGSQKQVSKEVEDTFQWGPFVMGGAVRLDTTRTDQMHNTLFGRGSVQVRMKRVTAYGFMETGRDLLNESVFATNSLNSTTLGATVRIGHGWNLLGEAFRSSLTSQLNPAHIFLLQGQGVEVPSTLGGLNQWSFFVRMTKDIRWGKGLERSTIDQFAAESKPVTGSVEGFVFDTDSTTRKPVRGIAVSLDGSRVAETDASGRFRFSEVAEGPHRVVLAIEQLPADFTPGLDPTPDTLVIKAGKITRQDFTVHRLSEIRGLVRGPQGLALDSIVLDLKPGARYTTPEVTGEFVFRDVVAGKYEVVVRPESLPPQTRLTTQAKWEVEVSRNTRPQVEFALEKVEVVVPVRRVLQNKVISVASPDLNRR